MSDVVHLWQQPLPAIEATARQLGWVVFDPQAGELPAVCGVML